MSDTDKSQEELLAFVTDPKNIAAAVEGSMEKRQAVFDKSELEKMLQFDKNSLASSIAWGRNHGKTAGEVADSIWPQFQTLITQQCNNLLFDLDEIDNKPWRVYRQLAKLVPECEETYTRLASFAEQGGMRDLDIFLSLPKDAQAKETEETHE